MPRGGKGPITDAQRRTIAKGKLQGKTINNIAAEVGLSREAVSRTANHDPGTLTMIARLKAKSQREFESIWTDMIKGIQKDMKSKDFNERATTRAQFLRIITAGDPIQRSIETSSVGDFTLEELLSEMRRVREKAE